MKTIATTRHHLSLLALLLAFLISLSPPHAAHAAAPASQETAHGNSQWDKAALSWEDLANEAAALSEWSSDPLADVLPEPSPWTLGSSFSASYGYSDNFLKRRQPVSSPFLRLSADGFANYLASAVSVTGLLFLEHTSYQNGPSAADDEWVAYALLSTETIAHSGIRYGTEANLLFVDQIYDASLSLDSQPVGERIRRLRPRVLFFTDSAFSRKDRLRLSAKTGYHAFEDESENYLRPALALTWSRQWTPALLAETTLEAATERYADRLSRFSSSLPLPSESPLRLRVFSIEQEWSWEPAKDNPTEIASAFGFRRERDPTGTYDDNRLLWANLSLSSKIHFLTIDLSARWQNRRYLDRQVNFSDQRPLQQIYRSFTFRLTAPLNQRWELALELTTADFASRDSSASYAEHRGLALLRWSY